MTHTRPSDLHHLFEPKGIAVIGASANPAKLGAVMTRALSASGLPLALINAKPGPGMYATVADAVAAEGAIYDLAVLCVPASVTASALRDAAAAGVRAALVCSGGFSEAGGEGIGYGADVAAAVKEGGIRLLGPNTSGFFVPALGLRASFVPGVAQVTGGSIGIVAASGGVNHLLAFKLQRLGAGVSVGVGLGAAGDVGAPEVLRYLSGHSDTKAILLHVESVTHGPELLAAVREAALHKPVIALVVGQNDVAEFAQSHTGALTTSWRTTRDLLRQSGAAIVDDEDALVLSGIALSRWRAAPHPDLGVGLVTGQAGPGLILADTMKGAGVAMPPLSAQSVERLGTLLPPLTFQGNPVDTGRPSETFPEVLRAVAADPSIGLVAAYTLTEPIVNLPKAVDESGVAEVVPALIGIDGPESELQDAIESGRDLGLPVFSGPTALARAVVAIVSDARTQHIIAQDAAAHVGHDQAVIAQSDGGWDEIAAKDILDSLGITTPRRARCRTREQAHDALVEVGAPAAVKLVDASVLHKSDVGGVFLGITTPHELDEALDSLTAIGATEFLVERMAPRGVDLFVGVRRDEAFGPVAVMGIGGIAAELMADVAVRSIPTGPATFDSMVDSLTTRDLLFGFRGGPTLDRGELATVLQALSAALVANPHIAEIEVNPLRLTSEGLVALDAVIIAAESE